MKLRRAFFFSFIIYALFLPEKVVHAVTEENRFDGITKPEKEIELSFIQAGIIQELPVNEGDFVQSGQIVLTQVDSIEQLQLKILQQRAENMVPINLAQLELEQKKKDLNSLQNALEKGATTEWEVDHASMDVDNALLTLKMREFDHKQDLLKHQSMIERIKQLSIKSPIDGVIEEIKVETSEGIQALVPAISIVDNNPLVIDLAVPVEKSTSLKKDGKANVTFWDGTTVSGTIIGRSTIADAAAATLEIKISIPNPDNRPAGERVAVTFDQLPQNEEGNTTPINALSN